MKSFLNKNTSNFYLNENEVSEAIYRINVGKNLGKELCYKAFLRILKSHDLKTRDVQLGALLNGLMAKIPTEDEIIGLLQAVSVVDNFDFTKKERVELPKGKKIVGAVGSGKKGYKTINISTAAMIVSSATGIYTAKPGSNSTSSVTGSADIMREIGVNIDLEKKEMIKILKKTKFGFFTIEKQIPNFDHVYGGKFFAPHALSFALPALLCPIHLDSILYGLAHPLIDISAKTLKQMGIKNVMVVSTTDDNIHYLDEMGIYGTTRILGVRDGILGKQVLYQPSEVLNLPCYSPLDIAQGKNVEENIHYFLEVLSGKSSEARENVVCINAGTLIYLAGEAEDLKEGFSKAKKAIKTGKSFEKLIEIIEATNGNKEVVNKYLKGKL